MDNLIMPVRDIEQSIWFESPRQSLAGNCFMKKLTTEEFIRRSVAVHGDKYNYDLAVYVDSHTKIKIICPRHGVFEKRIDSHLRGGGCPQCVRIKFTTEEFIQKAKHIHGDFYDYSKSEYVRWNIKVIIICPLHGMFEQSPNGHLCGHGCPKCSQQRVTKKMSSTTEKFIDNAIGIHGVRYDYSQVEYVKAREKIKINCNKHGIFLQTPQSHLAGNGCPKCGNESIINKLRIGLDEFINRANNIHLERYDYSKVVYSGLENKVEIICPQHGRFYQNAIDHLRGGDCPKCRGSFGEKFIMGVLGLYNVRYEIQKTFPTCLIKQRMKFDFYLPDYNILIEYQGIQHFRVTEHWGGLRSYMVTKRNDEYKKRWATENGYVFKEYAYKDSWDYIKKDLFKTIMECQQLVS